MRHLTGRPCGLEARVSALGSRPCLQPLRASRVRISGTPSGCQQRRLHVRALVAVGPGPACDFEKIVPDTDAGRGPEWSPHDNFPLRQAMLACTAAAELRTLLQTHGPELGPADVAAAWHVAVQQRLLTLARSGDAGEAALASHLLALAASHVDAMDPAALSTVAWALASSESGDQALMGRVLSAAERSMIQFSPPQLCTLLWAAAAHPVLDSAAKAGPFVALAGLVDSGMVLDLFSSRDLSVLLWSMGKTAYAHPVVLASAEAACAARMDDFTPGDIARAMHGFSMVRHNPLAVRGPLQERWGNKDAIAAFSPDDLTRLLVAHGVLGLEPDYAFMRAAIQHASSLVPGLPKTSKRSTRKSAPPPPIQDLHPRHLAHILWALARLDFRPGDVGLFNRIMVHLEALPGVYAADDLSAILWASSRLEISMPGAALESVAQRATFLAPREPPETVASLLRHFAAAAATAGSAPPGARKFAAVGAAVLVPVVGKLDSEALASVVVALGALEMPALPLGAVVRLQRAVLASASRFSSETLPQLAWATVRLRWTAPRLQDALCVAAAARAPLIPPEGLAQLAWAFAGMERTHLHLADVLASQCLVKLRFFAPKDKARLAWAMAHLAPRHPAAITQRHLNAVVRSIEKSELAKMDAVGVAAVAWACGRLDNHPGPILEAAAQRALTARGAFTQEQLAHMKAVLAKHGSALADAL